MAKEAMLDEWYPVGLFSQVKTTAYKTALMGEPIEVSVGEKILFQKYAGTEFKLDDEDLLILSQKDVLAVIQ